MKHHALPIPAFQTTEFVQEDLLCDTPYCYTGNYLNTSNYILQDLTEYHAYKTLDSFLEERVSKYIKSLSSPSLSTKGCSRLSVHLSWGTISLRKVYKRALEKIKDLKTEGKKLGKSRYEIIRNINAFLSRLHWHDHFIQRIEILPNLENQALHPAYRNIPYANDTQTLQAWLHGFTGEPMVDACMRALQKTGYINFRMRAMVVSYACFVLHLDWRFIGYELGKIFLDYEPGIHWSQLQMQSGVSGINTIRVYDPLKQLKDHDPDCLFVREWVPEIRSLSNERILEYRQNPLHYGVIRFDYKSQSKIMKDIVYNIKKSIPPHSQNRILAQLRGRTTKK